MTARVSTNRPAVWGGVECTVARIGNRYVDQLDLTGHAWRDDDVDRIADLGVRTVRYPILWERIERQRGQMDWDWPDRRLARLRALGIDVVAGLVHHGSGPPWTSLLDDSFATGLAEFAGRVAERYPWIRRFTVVNEPLTTARFSTLYGHWYPHRRDDRAFVRALLTQCRATVLAMAAIRRCRPDAQLVQTEDVSVTTGSPAMQALARFYSERAWLSLDLLCGQITESHPLREYFERWGADRCDLDFFRTASASPDLVGLNYYVTSDRYVDDAVEQYPGWRRGDRPAFVDIEAARAPCGIAGHLSHIETAWRRYRRPIAITEVHIDCAPDQQVCWFLEAWDAALAARAAHIPVEAVTPWALVGAVDWDSLLTRSQGHYECGALNVRHPAAPERPLRRAIVAAAHGHVPARPACRDGWWRQDSRLMASELRCEAS